MCEALLSNASFLKSYSHEAVYFLDCGIMEAFSSGFSECSGIDDYQGNESSKNLAHNPRANPPSDFTPNTQKNALNAQNTLPQSITQSIKKTKNLKRQNQPKTSIQGKSTARNLFSDFEKSLDSTDSIDSLDSSDLGISKRDSNPRKSQKPSPKQSLSQARANPQTQNLNKNLSQTQNPLITATIENIKTKYLSTKRAFVVTFSGGKDSTCVLQLVYEMLCDLPPALRRPTFAIASNTLVEAPHIASFLRAVISSINAHAEQHHIPFKVIEVMPSIKDDFWLNLIGKGYPSPTRTFRWCTERLKITPAKAEVAKITREFGSCVLLLGSRKSESSARKASIQKRVLTDEGYSKHNDFPDTLTFSPIAEWSIDDVWGYLISHKPRWDKDHSELFALYAKASGDECQFITDLAQSSCGGSRFGCWVCTVVNEDKSMQGFIDAGEARLKPLNNFRNLIKEWREDSTKRADYKRDGRAVYKVGGLGPFLSKTRIAMLEKLLETEAEFIKNGGENLISDAQILAIQKAWDKDFDFSHTAIKIAQTFNHLKEMTMAKQSKILHKELLEEVANEIISKEDLESIIEKGLEVYSNVSSRSKTKASYHIREEIKKLLDDKTTKAKGDDNVY